MSFDDGIKSKGILPCACGKPDCPVFMIEHSYCERLESERERVLAHVSEALSELGTSMAFRSSPNNLSR
jgi:hypothetical protein